MPKTDGYYYLHTNGDLIYKPASVMDSDPSYFDSSFVKKVWALDLSDRGDAYSMLLEAEAMGARVERIHELKAKWKITEEDTQTFAIEWVFYYLWTAINGLRDYLILRTCKNHPLALATQGGMR